MQAGLLNESIDIVVPISEETQYGSKNVTWQVQWHTKARVMRQSGSTGNVNNEIATIYSQQFTVRYYWKDKIKETMRIEWNGNQYEIKTLFPDKALQQLVINTEMIID